MMNYTDGLVSASLFFLAAVSTTGSAAGQGPDGRAASSRRKGAGPELAVDHQQQRIIFNGKALPNFSLEAIEAVFGPWERKECRQYPGRFERRPMLGGRPTSEVRTFTDCYYIYDSLGLMFVADGMLYTTRASPTRLVVWFNRKLRSQRTPLIRVWPKKKFKGRLLLNKQLVTPGDMGQRVTFEQAGKGLALYGCLFRGATMGAEVESLYAYEHVPATTLFLAAGSRTSLSHMTLIWPRGR